MTNATEQKFPFKYTFYCLTKAWLLTDFCVRVWKIREIEKFLLKCFCILHKLWFKYAWQYERKTIGQSGSSISLQLLQLNNTFDYQMYCIIINISQHLQTSLPNPS